MLYVRLALPKTRDSRKTGQFCPVVLLRPFISKKTIFMNKEAKKVLIIGAGPAGLTAAYMILKTTDMHPIILEASEHVGGLARSVAAGTSISDLGPHLYCTNISEVKEIWDRFMPLQGAYAKDDLLLQKNFLLNKNGPDPECKDAVMLRRDRCSRIIYDGKFFSYPLSFSFETIRKLGILKTFYFGIGLLWVKIFRRKGDNLECFLQNHFGLTLYKDIFRGYTVKSWGRDPSNISNASGVQRIVGISILKAVVGVLCSIFHVRLKPRHKNGALPINEVLEFYYPKLGSGNMWELMASEVTAMGGEIHFNEEVTGIHIEEGKVVSAYTRGIKNSIEWIADYVISTLAIKDLFEAFDNRKEIPEDIYSAAVNLPYRDFISVTLVVKQLKIKNNTEIPTINGIIPDCWSYVYNEKVRTNRFNIFNNFSPYIVPNWPDHVVIGMEYFSSVGDDIWVRSDEELVEMAALEAEELGLIDKKELLYGISTKCQKAYPGYFESYMNFDQIKAHISKLENLYCAGRNGQHKYFDMDQAMFSAMKCVEGIRTGNKDLMWDVK